jgi:hypothetical protein
MRVTSVKHGAITLHRLPPATRYPELTKRQGRACWEALCLSHRSEKHCGFSAGAYYYQHFKLRGSLVQPLGFHGCTPRGRKGAVNGCCKLRVEHFRDEAPWEADGRAWGLRIDMETRSWGVGRAYVMR